MGIDRRRRRYGAGGGEIGLFLIGASGLTVDPDVEILVVTQASTPEVRWDGGAWTAWSSGMKISDLIDVIPLVAQNYALDARASGVDAITLNVGVPTFVVDGASDLVIDSSGNYVVQ